MGNLRHKSPAWRRYLPQAIKGVTAVGLLGALYYQLFVLESFGELWVEFEARLAVAPVWIPLLVAALVPLNIALEGGKFNLLLPASRRPGLREATARVCAGLTVGMFTPNRVGEYIGRLTYAYPGERAATVIATLLGGVAQWIPLMWGGATAALLWPLLTDRQSPAFGSQILLAVAVGGLLVAGFLNLSHLVRGLGRGLGSVGRFLLRYDRLTWFGQRLHVFRTRVLSLGHAAAARPGDLRRALGVAWLRYVIYLSQLTLAFVYCGLDAPPAAAVAGTAAIFLAQTFLPVPAFVQAVARVQLAVVLWGDYAPNEVGLATASLLIFVLNLGLPALVGLGIILRADVEQTFGPTPVGEPERPGARGRAGVVGTGGRP